MAHRTLKDIAALYRFGLPEGRLNGKGREASLSIASSQSPAVQPGNGCTTRVRDPSNSAPANQIGSGSRYTHRPLDTRRYRVNKIEGEEEPSRTGITPHRTPRPPWPCPVWVEQVDHERSPRTTRSFYGLPTGRITLQALVSVPSRAMEG